MSLVNLFISFYNHFMSNFAASSNSPLSVSKLQKESRFVTRKASRFDPKASAEQILEKGAIAAAKSLVELSTSAAEDKDKISASKDILDRAGVGKSRSNDNLPSIDMKFLSAALVGIAALAGRDISMMGDLTDLQEKLEPLNQSLNNRSIDGEFEEVEENE
jgi:hypothetical protein